MITVVGNFLSPYVRKVLVALAVKRQPYRIDPLTPFFGSDSFRALSPLQRIPVLIDGDFTLCDSTVICEYLEERFDGPSLFPTGLRERARARWFEEYADSRMGDVFIWRLFNQLVLRRGIWREQPDEAVVTKAQREDVPDILTYLESQLPPEGWLFAGFAIADAAIGSMFRNYFYCRQTLDADRWPRTAAYVARVHAHPAFTALKSIEDVLIATRAPQQRAALEALGVPLTETSFSGEVPRRGIMPLG